MMQQEYAMSLLSCKLGDDPNPYYVVGTGTSVLHTVIIQKADTLLPEHPKFGHFSILYSGELKSGLVQISNGQKQIGSQMVGISNSI